MPNISIYLLTAFTAWLVAETMKYVFSSMKSGQWFSGSSVFHSGNMPSVHTATTVALAVSIGLKDGIDSPVFALAILFMAVVAYDAMGVRRAAGEQGLALRQLLKKDGPKPYQALGHKPIEVLVGALIGILVSFIIVFLTVS